MSRTAAGDRGCVKTRPTHNFGSLLTLDASTIVDPGAIWSRDLLLPRSTAEFSHSLDPLVPFGGIQRMSVAQRLQSLSPPG